MLIEFKQGLKNYKPKASGLEIGILKTKDEGQISIFKEAIKEQNHSKLIKQEREKMRAHYDREVEKHAELLQQNQIEMKTIEKKNDEILQSRSASENKIRLSKKRRARIEKINTDSSLNETEKENLISQLEKQVCENKKQKRSQMDDFKDRTNFVTSERAPTSENKVNSSSLWGEGEKNFLEDVTINMSGADDDGKNLKGRKVMKWDATKKRYMVKNIDRDGKVIAEKRNEAGKKITKKMKEKEKVSIYKKWQQRTHLTLQKTGEMEDQKAMDQAKRANDSRKTIKDFKDRHGQELHKGTDARSHDTLIAKKQQKLQAKMQAMNQKKPRAGPGGRSFSDKSMAKIQSASRPTKSKMIVKAGGLGGGGRGKKGGSRGRR